MTKFMPILRFSADQIASKLIEIRKSNCPFAVVQIPWYLLEPHEKQARINHGQTLERLAERGGLSPCEALAIIEDRKHKKMNYAEANQELCLRIIQGY